MSNVDLFVVQQHSIDSLDSSLRSLRRLIVNEPIAFGPALLVDSDLAGQDITESSKGIVKSLFLL